MSEGKTTLLEETKEQFQTRLNELQPLVDEAHQLEQALTAMNGKMGQQQMKRKPRGTSATAPARAGRGQRPQEFMALVRQEPGIKVSEAADKMGVNTTYLYRIVGKLASGDSPQIKKNEDGGYEPAA